MRTIFTDESVFSQIKEKSRNAYIKSWEDFKNYLAGHNFEECHPGEEDIISFFNHLRLEKKMATSSIWTIYSYINSVMKRKYGWKLQSLPRITMTIKGYEEDTKNKAAIFEEDDLRRFWTMKMDSAYWTVRRAIAITAYFGGLRMVECMDLALEKIIRGPEGFTITHTRAKQRSDKMSTKFLVPQEGGYADLLASYLDLVKNQLYQYSGRVWYTGRKTDNLTCQTMGKNSVSKVPHEIAALLKLADPSKYTFHSFRRTSATRAADAGATSEQLVDFYGWKNSSMCQEYISSSRPAILGMANRLSSTVQPSINDSNEEVTVNGDGVPDLGGLTVTETSKPEAEEEQVIADMEEDEDMLENVGIFSQKVINDTVTGQQCVVEAAIKETLSAIPGTKGANIKVIVVNKMSGGNINL